ncbi:carbamoyl phosphate synthase small subunit [Gloeomargarita lithophora Alchichica-D10]|uniref:Carbamoyl phosphate synthase small chain n=1 Tax=Gloeomargarita lithophora Alchichica-D10 TaxID=1188229 RepID=A0A1J0A8Z7_9CYAN|nr:glutamine-hydrolyzing carbamoyl-phosphate synthase small subunit [Gloeomargarita lithophora]APB32410.1 carbamoyl phosphate synthase small subunit [Gloeomargarita lithophora Alchichica-D10]
MALNPAPPALLVLADGTALRGYRYGAQGTTVGEVVFNTGMTGYQEVLTDPSYCGQMVLFTYPELGNTGVNSEDGESPRVQVQGVIVRHGCRQPSNWRAQESLADYLERWRVVGISGVDTRLLTRRLREQGAMNGAISTEILDPQELLERVAQAPSMAGLNLVPRVSTAQVYEWHTPTPKQWEFAAVCPQPDPLVVVAIDFGIKHNILRRLASYGCRVVVVPASTPAADILAYDPDGIFLSNGPGDPAAVTEGIATAQALVKTGRPLFGICLGHQILGLALGSQTFKLKFGHHGLNHPAGLGNQVAISSQNHGFALDRDTLAPELQITDWNLNDQTVAGLRHQELPIFSVQYHPEASPGPHDADNLFAQFVAQMEHYRQIQRG